MSRQTASGEGMVFSTIDQITSDFMKERQHNPAMENKPQQNDMRGQDADKTPEENDKPHLSDRDLKGKKEDGDPSLESDQPIKQNTD